MNITEKELKLIERYLDENLDSEQLEEFNQALESEPFREQLMFQAQIVDETKSIGRDKLRERLEELAPPKKKPINRRSLFLLFAIIGIYLALFFANRMMQPDATGTELFAEYFVELPPDVSKRGVENEFALDYQQAMQHYIDKDYRTALLAFSNLAGGSDDIELYKAMCLLQLEENKKLSMTLMPLLKSKEKRIRQNANWYLILLSVKESDFTKAKESLTYVINNETHMFRKQAIRLKGELEK